MALNSTSAGSLLPGVSNRHIKLLNETWANMIQQAEYHGVRIIARCLAKNPGLARLFPKLPACKRCKNCRSLRSNSTAIQYGHILLMHITDIITNLRNNTTLKNYIRQKACLLREAGVTKEDIEMCQDELISYLAESQPSKWSAEASSAWKLMSAAIITLGTQEWHPPIVSYKKKDTPRANSICDFRSVSSQY